MRADSAQKLEQQLVDFLRLLFRERMASALDEVAAATAALACDVIAE